MKHPITVQEHDQTYTASNGKLGGTVRHVFTSPTHWSDICTVQVRYNPHAPTEVSLQYGSGGWSKDATDIDVADTLSHAFALASALMARLMTVESESTQQPHNLVG